MFKDTQRSGSRWQCRMSIRKHFQLRYLILKFFRSRAHLVPSRIRPSPSPSTSPSPTELPDARMRIQDAGLPGQVLGAPPPSSQASPSQGRPDCDWPPSAPRWTVRFFRAGMQTREERPVLKPLSRQPCVTYCICINSLIFPTTH